MLYRFFDARGTLLYVGITDDPRARWSGHAHKARHKENAWWHQVHIVHTEWLPTRAEAEAAEIISIRHEHPVHNSAHNIRIGAGRKFRSMYIHPMAREVFRDDPFTYRELSEKLDIPYGTVSLYGRRLEQQGAFLRVGDVPSPAPRGRRRSTFIAVDVPPELASPVKAPLLDQE
jgi:predicted GIY-YIG superfamily endonuclease